MRRAHSSRSCVRFCRRCATNSRNSAAVDSLCAWGSGGGGDCASLPLVVMAGGPRPVECCLGATARLVQGSHARFDAVTTLFQNKLRITTSPLFDTIAAV